MSGEDGSGSENVAGGSEEIQQQNPEELGKIVSVCCVF